MPDEYIKIGKDNYRHILSTGDKEKATRTAKRFRDEGRLVRVLKKTHKMSTGSNETVYHVYHCTSNRRKSKWVT